MAKKIQRFIIVDDDAFNNSLCKFIIRKSAGDTGFIDFVWPEEALSYIESFYGNPETDHPTVIFLDITMPVISGWDFLEKYDAFSEHIKNQCTIYILSTSYDLHDKEKALNNKYVKNYLIRPLTKESVLKILADFE